MSRGERSGSRRLQGRLLLGIWCLLAGSTGQEAEAGPARLLRDLRAPESWASLDPQMTLREPPGAWDSRGIDYFTAETEEWGRELWRSDRTTEGTRMVVDLRPGPESSDPLVLPPPAGSHGIFFSADDGIHGRELWWSDGTPSGTVLVRDICPGACSGLQASGGWSGAGVAGETLLFAATDDPEARWNDRTLWRSDGTEAGTEPLCPACGFDANLLVYGFGNWIVSTGDRAYFRFDWDLWVTDGSDAGTKNLNPSARLGGAWYLESTAVRDGLFYSVRGGPDSFEIWRSDGTVRGTRRVLDTGSLVYLPMMTAVGDAVFVAVPKREDSGRIQHTEIWRTDGETSEFLVRLQDVDPFQFDSAGGVAYVGSWAALIRTDGTEAGSFTLATNAFLGVSSGDRMFLVGSESEPWVSDGTLAGTRLLVEVSSHNASNPWFWRASRGVYFSASDASEWLPDPTGGQGRELWWSDATGSEVRRVSDYAAASSLPEPAVVLGRRALLPARTVDGRRALWGTDGTPRGTVQLTQECGCGFLMDAPEELGGEGLFFCGRPWAPTSLWRTDGTAEGTRLVAPGVGSGRMTRLGDRVYWGHHSSYADTLLTSDGTAEGTLQISDVPDQISDLTAVEGALFFVAKSYSQGRELWRLNDAGDDVEVFSDLNPGQESSDPTALTAFQDQLYFAARDGGGSRLFRTRTLDGGVDVLADVEAEGLAASEERLFFSGRDELGAELWISDGTLDGTARVADIRPGPRSSRPEWLTAIGPRTFFSADDGDHGPELWVSDGTRQGTRMVRDVRPGPLGSRPRLLTEADGLLYFEAGDAATGRELWRSDGTPHGTRLVQDLGPGETGGLSSITPTPWGLLFGAWGGPELGTEPWLLSRSPIRMFRADSRGGAPPRSGRAPVDPIRLPR